MINRRHVEKLDDSCFLEYAIENDSDKVKQVINQIEQKPDVAKCAQRFARNIEKLMSVIGQKDNLTKKDLTEFINALGIPDHKQEKTREKISLTIDELWSYLNLSNEGSKSIDRAQVLKTMKVLLNPMLTIS